MKRLMVIALATIVTSLFASESAEACRRCCQVRCCRPVRTVCCTPCCYSNRGCCQGTMQVQPAPSDCGCGGTMTEMGTVVEPQPAGDVMMEQPVTAPPVEPAAPIEAPVVPEAPNEG